jgi:hypothetical protein
VTADIPVGEFREEYWSFAVEKVKKKEEKKVT